MTEKNYGYIYKSEDGSKKSHIHFITFSFSDEPTNNLKSIILQSNSEIPYITDLNCNLTEEENKLLIVRSICTMRNL